MFLRNTWYVVACDHENANTYAAAKAQKMLIVLIDGEHSTESGKKR